jgi:hypothetical protein
MVVIFLFGYACRTAQQSRSGEPETPRKTETKVTKDNLKTRLSGKKVMFIEEGGETGGSDRRDVDVRVEISPLRLRIVSAEKPPRIEFLGQIHEFRDLLARLKSIGRTDSVTLPATESDLSFYNSQGITVEDFEFVIRNLDEYIDEFKVDFLGRQLVPTVSPKSKTSGFPTLKSQIPKADYIPPPTKPKP